MRSLAAAPGPDHHGRGRASCPAERYAALDDYESGRFRAVVDPLSRPGGYTGFVPIDPRPDAELLALGAVIDDEMPEEIREAFEALTIRQLDTLPDDHPYRQWRRAQRENHDSWLNQDERARLKSGVTAAAGRQLQCHDEVIEIGSQIVAMPPSRRTVVRSS